MHAATKNGAFKMASISMVEICAFVDSRLKIEVNAFFNIAQYIPLQQWMSILLHFREMISAGIQTVLKLKTERSHPQWQSHNIKTSDNLYDTLLSPFPRPIAVLRFLTDIKNIYLSVCIV